MQLFQVRQPRPHDWSGVEKHHRRSRARSGQRSHVAAVGQLGAAPGGRSPLLATPDALWATVRRRCHALYANTVAQVIQVVGSDGSGGADAARASCLRPPIARSGSPSMPASLRAFSAGRCWRSRDTLAWTGYLGINDTITAGVIKGLWFTEQVAITNPNVLFPAPVSLSPGPLGIGNAAVDGVIATPAALAAHYNFPLAAQRGDGGGRPGRERQGRPGNAVRRLQSLSPAGRSARPGRSRSFPAPIHTSTAAPS